MNIAQRIATAILMACMLLSTTGCGAILLGGAGVAGTYAYLNGQSKGTYNASLTKSYEASLAACKALQIPVTLQTKNGASAQVEGKLSGDTVYISLKLIGDNLTQITVRVGLMGNESASHRIHNAIRERL